MQLAGTKRKQLVWKHVATLRAMRHVNDLPCRWVRVLALGF